MPNFFLFFVFFLSQDSTETHTAPAAEDADLPTLLKHMIALNSAYDRLRRLNGTREYVTAQKRTRAPGTLIRIHTCAQRARAHVRSLTHTYECTEYHMI